jgi:hypothetical protein
MAYKLLHQSMNHLTRTNIIKQESLAMTDGSQLIYNIDITIQTEQEHSIAYQKIKDLNNISLIESIELGLVHLLCDCPDTEPVSQEQQVIDFYLQDDEDPNDSIEPGAEENAA